MIEQLLGRELRKGEVVHHKNGDCTDDRIENLELLSSVKEHNHKHPEAHKKSIAAALAVREPKAHGGYRMFMLAKCQCDICLVAKDEYNAGRRVKRCTGKRGHYRVRA